MIKDKEGGTCRLFFFQFFNLSTGRLGGVFYPCSPFSSYNPPQMEMEIWRYVNMEILYQQADNFQFFNLSIFQSFYGELGGVF